MSSKSLSELGQRIKAWGCLLNLWLGVEGDKGEVKAKGWSFIMPHQHGICYQLLG